MSSAVTVTEASPGIALVTLNRPDRLNAMNYDLVRGLYDACDELAADRTCRVVVLTGAGRGFCAGLDLTEGASPPEAAGLGRAQAGMTVQKLIAGLVPKMRALPQPVIAAVNGAASGGGLALALASDVRIAAASARFNVAFIRVGLSGCDIGVSWMLPRLIGASRAFELLLTGRLIDAAEADRIGLVTRVVPDADVRRLRARDGRAHRRQQPVRRADDQGSDVEPARDRQPAGRHRSREPHAGAVELHRRPDRGDGGVRREAPAELQRQRSQTEEEQWRTDGLHW